MSVGKLLAREVESKLALVPWAEVKTFPLTGVFANDIWSYSFN
jgi:hypothetical protein